MKSIKEVSESKWKGFEMLDLNTLTSIRGGMLAAATTTSGGSYIARPGGGEFDDSTEDRQHESM